MLGVMTLSRMSCLTLGVLLVANVSLTMASEDPCGSDNEGPSLPSALSFLERHAMEAEQDLLALAAIPSISSMVDYHTHVLDAGKWLVRRLRRAGMKVGFTSTGLRSCQTPCMLRGRPIVPTVCCLMSL